MILKWLKIFLQFYHELYGNVLWLNKMPVSIQCLPIMSPYIINQKVTQIIVCVSHIHWSSKFRSCFIHLWKLWRVVFLLASYWLVTWPQATRISYPLNRCLPTLPSRSISPHLPTWPVTGSVLLPLGLLARKVGFFYWDFGNKSRNICFTLLQIILISNLCN